MTATPAQRSAAHTARLRQAGGKVVTLRLPPDAVAGLERAAAVHGSINAGAAAVLAAYSPSR